jgi:nitroreductase
MEFNEVVQGRRSIRAFLPDPVDREKIRKMVDLARWAPSWGNTQPWEVVVADGEKAAALARRFVEEAQSGSNPRSDIEMPVIFPDTHKARYMGLGRDLLTFMGVQRDDKEARMQHYMNMYRFFGAPTVVYFFIDRELNVPYACLDIGSIATTMCYAALEQGLGTIYLAASMHFPDIVRSVLEVSDEKKLVIGVAVGVPHPDAPASLFRSGRESMDRILRFA